MRRLVRQRATAFPARASVCFAWLRDRRRHDRRRPHEGATARELRAGPGNNTNRRGSTLKVCPPAKAQRRKEKKQRSEFLDSLGAFAPLRETLVQPTRNRSVIYGLLFGKLP